MTDLEAMVHQAMDNAEANGYDQRHGWTPEEVAADIAAYDSDLEGFDVELLLPHVRSWLESGPGYDPEAVPHSGTIRITE